MDGVGDAAKLKQDVQQLNSRQRLPPVCLVIAQTLVTTIDRLAVLCCTYESKKRDLKMATSLPSCILMFCEFRRARLLTRTV
jgi:hypothetical protein